MLKFLWQNWTELIPVSSSIVKTVCRIHVSQDLTVTTPPQDLICSTNFGKSAAYTPSSNLKMNVEGSSEKLTTHKTTRCHGTVRLSSKVRDNDNESLGPLM